MRFLRRYHYWVSFGGLLVFCNVMALRQIELNRTRHLEVREGFILLQAKGYEREAQRLFRILVETLPESSTSTLLVDYQRTLMLVKPGAERSQNLLWRYHGAVTRELEIRSEKNLARALKLVEKY